MHSKPPIKKARTIEQIARLLHNNSIKEENGCWLYQGSQNDAGNRHCKIFFEGRKVYIHRLSAKIHWNFDLNSSMLILHKTNCPNANCWNPEHLYEGTHSDNTIDMVKTGSHNSQTNTKVLCNNGHLLDGVRSNGKRYCKTCNRIRAGYLE